MTKTQAITLWIFIGAITFVGVLYAITWIQDLLKSKKSNKTKHE